MKTVHRVLLGAAALAVAAGCDPVIPNAPYTVTECPRFDVAFNCVNCLESACSDELAAANSACEAYLDCVCPVGGDAGACTPAADCTAALNRVTCPSCQASCGTPAASSGDAVAATDAGEEESDADSVFCSGSAGGDGFCYAYRHLAPAQRSAVASACGSTLAGTVAAGCPGPGLLGCCDQSASGAEVASCYYAGDSGMGASDYERACLATDSGAVWSTGLVP